jgi:hypothetical protein
MASVERNRNVFLISLPRLSLLENATAGIGYSPKIP